MRENTGKLKIKLAPEMTKIKPGASMPHVLLIVPNHDPRRVCCFSPLSLSGNIFIFKVLSADNSPTAGSCSTSKGENLRCFHDIENYIKSFPIL